MTDSRGQRGFTLAESLVAIAIFVIVAAILATTLQHALLWGRTVADRQTEHAQVEALVDRLHAEEDSAWAIFTPSTDVLGQSNADGHEFDMFARDGDNRPYFWAYRYDAAAHTVTKYLYPKPGATPIADSASTVNGVTSFSAATYTIDKLADSASPIYNPLYAGKLLTPVAIHYGYGTEVAGGNQITALSISGATTAESLQLTTQTAPTGFTIRFHYSKGALTVVPATVVYAVAGQSLAEILRAPNDLSGVVINDLLGGAVASAATCPAKALNALGSEIRPGSTEAAVLGISDPKGCYDGHVVANESAFHGSFSYNISSCAGMLIPYGWLPSPSGPTASLSLEAGASLGACSFTISDGVVGSNNLSVMAKIVGYFCPNAGESCTVTGAPWRDDSPACDTQGGGFQNGFNGVGSYSTAWGSLTAANAGSTLTTPYGTFLINGDQSVTFARTLPGSVTLTAREQYYTYNVTATKGGWTCKVSSSVPAVASWAF